MSSSGQLRHLELVTVGDLDPEARAAAQIRHTHLVRVFGSGQFGITAYIAMELLDGPDLE